LAKARTRNSGELIAMSVKAGDKALFGNGPAGELEELRCIVVW
jgi:hypothetical protein